METWDAIRARRNVRQYTDQPITRENLERIGSGHSSVVDQGQAQRVLGFPDGYLAVYLIGLGYPADRPLRPIARPDRRPFDEVVHWDHW